MRGVWKVIAAMTTNAEQDRSVGVLGMTVDPSEELWNVASSTASIRQIYGHFLAPRLMEAVRSGLVAKDFNFPSAYHAATGRNLEEVLEDIALISESTRFSLSRGVRVRSEAEGVIIYTPHFNGYFANTMGALILEALRSRVQLPLVAETTGFDIDEIKDFIADLLVLGIADVEHASVPV